jgi:hypothetical protein
MSKFSGVKTAAFLTVLGLIIAGCAPQAGRTTRQYDENWRFVPRVHVQENSFFGGDYRGCSYDTMYEGYWCPIR